MPGDEIPSNSMFELLQFDKFAHTSIFGLMTILFIRPIAMSDWNKKIKLDYYIRIAISIAIWGLATEFIQLFFIPNRDFDLFDFVADATGCTLAYLFSRKYLLR